MKKLILTTALATSLFADEYTCDVMVQKAVLYSQKARELHFMGLQDESCMASKSGFNSAMNAKIECEMFGIDKYKRDLEGLIFNFQKINEKFCK